MSLFPGKTAFITGGASGIGLGLARACAREGMQVMIADIRAADLEAARTSLATEGLEVATHTLDVADRAAMAAAAEHVTSRFGGVYLLANNAGVNLFAPIETCSYDDWDWVMGVNLGGVINGVQAFLPHMLARGEGGHILNTASMAGLIAVPGAGIYTTTKFAVRGLSEALRMSLAHHGIGVSCLCPGLVKSTIYRSEAIRPRHLRNSSAKVDADFAARLADMHEVGMHPDEVAAKALAGIRDNLAYIFPHPEFHDEVGQIFADILAAMPDEPPDPARLAFEEDRRRRMRHP